MSGRSATLVLLVLLAVAGCGSVERPAVGEWVPLWEDAQLALPDVGAGEPSEGECSEALVSLREIAPSLRPTPDDSIDETVDRWVVVAEETMFECPPTSGEFNSFQSAYRELDRLASQIEVVIYGS